MLRVLPRRCGRAALVPRPRLAQIVPSAPVNAHQPCDHHAQHWPKAESDRALTSLQAAACTYRIALGPHAGQKVLSLRTVPSRAADSTQSGCVNAHGFSLHAAVRYNAHQRRELERLCRYITRPAIANERLKRNPAGQVLLQLKSPYRDGTTHIVMSPLELMQRLSHTGPAPAAASDSLHGALAPQAKLRAQIVPGAPLNAHEACEHQIRR